MYHNDNDTVRPHKPVVVCKMKYRVFCTRHQEESLGSQRVFRTYTEIQSEKTFHKDTLDCLFIVVPHGPSLISQLHPLQTPGNMDKIVSKKHTSICEEQILYICTIYTSKSHSSNIYFPFKTLPVCFGINFKPANWTLNKEWTSLLTKVSLTTNTKIIIP